MIKHNDVGGSYKLTGEDFRGRTSGSDMKLGVDE